MRAPEGWEHDSLAGGITVTATDYRRNDLVAVSSGGQPPEQDLEAVAKLGQGVLRGSERQPNVTIGGREAYHLVKKDPTDWIIEFGTLAGTEVVAFTFDFDTRSPAYQQKVIESVLATVEWKQ